MIYTPVPKYGFPLRIEDLTRTTEVWARPLPLPSKERSSALDRVFEGMIREEDVLSSDARYLLVDGDVSIRHPRTGEFIYDEAEGSQNTSLVKYRGITGLLDKKIRLRIVGIGAQLTENNLQIVLDSNALVSSTVTHFMPTAPTESFLDSYGEDDLQLDHEIIYFNPPNTVEGIIPGRLLGYRVAKSFR